MNVRQEYTSLYHEKLRSCTNEIRSKNNNKVSISRNDSIYAIIGDIKDKGHNGCSSDRDGSMVEFIVDTQVIDPKIKSSGNFNDVYQGKIERIINYGKHT